MAFIRRAGWFVMIAVMMAGWMGVLAGARGVAEAGLISSHVAEGKADAAAGDLARMQAFLEGKVVAQKLADYGVSPEEAVAKVKQMSAADLHRLASMTEKAAAGGDDGVGLLISVAILVILVIVILKLLDKEIIVR